jgi:hypothetical protein
MSWTAKVIIGGQLISHASDKAANIYRHVAHVTLGAATFTAPVPCPSKRHRRSALRQKALIRLLHRAAALTRHAARQLHGDLRSSGSTMVQAS